MSRNAKAIYLVYLASWHNLVPEPALVSEVTHVCLAFVSPSIFNGPDLPTPSDLDPFFTKIDTIRAQFAADVKIMWALGGWGDTEGFGLAAKTKESRKLFARNVKHLLDITSTDGIDLDWEYPGGNGENYKNPGTTNADKSWEVEAYPELVFELRSALGDEGILSAAVPCLPRDMIAFDATNIGKIAPHMDFLNLMTYDLINRRDAVTKHHAGIEASLEGVDRYLANGLPPHKAVLGLGFYAKWFKIVPLQEHIGPICSPIGLPTVQMEDPTTGDDLGTSGAFVWCEDPPPSITDSFERAMAQGRYDDRHKGHYYLDDQEGIFWSWESKEAIERKVERIIGQRGLGGVFAWELGGDSRDWSHLKALNSAFKVAFPTNGGHSEL